MLVALLAVQITLGHAERTPEPARLFAESAAALADGDDATALARSSEGLELQPSFAPAYRTLADAAFRMGRPDLALAAFTRLAARDPRNPYPHFGLGLSQRRLGRLAEAKMSLAAALDRAPDCVPALREYLKVAQASGEIDAALQELQLRARRFPAARAELTYALAYGNLLAYRLREAEALLDRAEALRPMPEIALARAQIRYEQVLGKECLGAVAEGLKLAAAEAPAGVVGELRLVESDCLSNFTDRDAMVAAAEAAREEFERQGDLAGTADALRLSARMSVQARHEQALALVEQAIRVHQALGETASLAQDYLHRGWKLEPFDAAGSSLASFRSAAEIARRAGDRRTELRARSAVAAALVRLYRWGEALEQAFAACELAQRLGAKRSEAVNAANAAVAFRRMGDTGRAWEFAQRALALFRDFGTPGDEAAVLGDLGAICLERGEPASAAAYYRRAEAGLRGTNGGPVEHTLIGLGHALKALGAVEEAREVFQQACGLARAARTPSVEAAGERALGELELSLGRHRQAIAHFEAALRLVLAEEAEPEIALIAHRGLAVSHAALGDRRRALEHYRRAIGWIEALRAEVKLSSLRSLFFADRRSVYAEAVDLLFEMHQAAPGAGHDREAFSFAEKARARALLEAVALGPRKASGAPARASIADRLSRIQAQLLREDLPEDDRGRLERALAREERALADLDLDVLKQPGPRDPDPEPATVERAAAALPPGSVLAEFLLGAQRSYLFVVSSDGHLSMHRLPPRREIEELVSGFRSEIAQRPTPATLAASLARIRRTGGALYERLLGADETARAARQLLVVPDGVLFYLPFGALPRGPRGGYLGGEAEVSYASSASVLAMLRARPPCAPAPGGRELLAFGDPEPIRGAGSTEAGAAGALVRGLVESGVAFARLPSSRQEVLGLARLFGPGSSRVFLGAQFQRSTVTREIATPSRYVHFATHAVVDDEVPERSGLIASGSPDQEGSGVGFLQAREIAELKIDAEMVTLSACQTGLGRLTEGEGIVGLARAFQVAGARSLLVSLWNVSDYSTSKFMSGFYGRLRRGETKASALRAARRAMLGEANPLLRHPYHWAGFVLTGAP